MEGLKSALETTKQVVALSTGVIALTVTFLEKVVQPGASAVRVVPGALKVGWIAYGLAILFAVWTLMAITGTLNALDRQARGLTLTAAQTTASQELCDGANVRVPSLLMLLSFLVGTLLTIASGFYL